MKPVISSNISSFKFTKMHGLGNDFIVMNGLEQAISLHPTHIQQSAHRQLGIGFDQLLLIHPSTEADIFCRIFNSDGSEAEQCGNGLRCVARFIHEENILKKNKGTIETKAGIFSITIKDYNHIEVEMGTPKFLTSLTSFPHVNKEIFALSLGNPHAIVIVPDVTHCPLLEWGPLINSSFPQGVNVGFMEIINSQAIRLRTYERGVGETLACGSNACAAVITGIQQGLLTSPTTVFLALGELEIAWNKNETPVRMTGPASRVFEGTIEIF